MLEWKLGQLARCNESLSNRCLSYTNNSHRTHLSTRHERAKCKMYASKVAEPLTEPMRLIVCVSDLASVEAMRKYCERSCDDNIELSCIIMHKFSWTPELVMKTIVSTTELSAAARQRKFQTPQDAIPTSAVTTNTQVESG